ncbi:GNAT family protein [Metasolibacillus sp. FSL H7-0170]|uniref:GNAT family N-acetyltransferase n=1 Tax=Metasolibacillus TaxID=2703677 RepID=UPI001912F30D|nr:GNAT family protein [Metasolibacillus fluoroglycofenilyticus]
MKMETLQNEIVRLVHIERAHIDGIYEAAHDERIWAHTSLHLMTKTAVENYVETAIKQREASTVITFVIINQATEKIVGATSLFDFDNAHKRLEIGYTWLTPACWGTAINTNCKYILLAYCFERLAMNRVQLKTDNENKRSQQAIERIGAKKEGILRNHMVRKNGTLRDTHLYSITKEEWPQVKQYFEQTLLK